jgi:hypothetical protein
VGQGEEVGQRADGEDIGVKKYDLGVLCETEYMQFCKDSVEIKTT